MTTYLPCSCLNVTLHLIERPSLFHDNLQTLIKPLVSDALWENDVYKGVFNLGGVVVQHNELVHSRTVKGWTVFRCINCMTDVYAVLSSDNSFIAINKCMVNRENENPNNNPSSSSSPLKFSPAFHVMVDCTTSQESDTFVPSFSDVEASTLFSALQLSVQKYYDEEQKQMTKRISAYMEQEEAEFKKTYARALKDRDAIWGKVKLYLFEKRKSDAAARELESTACAESDAAESLLEREKQAQAEKRESLESVTSAFLDELSRANSMALELHNSYDPKSDDGGPFFHEMLDEGDDDDDDGDDGSMRFMGIFEVDDVTLSPTTDPSAEEDASIGNGSNSSSSGPAEGDDFWEQEPNLSYAGFSSVEKQGLRAPKPSSSLPISIRHRNSDRPSQAEFSPRVTEEEGLDFCRGLVVDSQYKSVPFFDKASSFSVPKKRMTFL